MKSLWAHPYSWQSVHLLINANSAFHGENPPPQKQHEVQQKGKSPSRRHVEGTPRSACISWSFLLGWCYHLVGVAGKRQPQQLWSPAHQQAIKISFQFDWKYSEKYKKINGLQISSLLVFACSQGGLQASSEACWKRFALSKQQVKTLKGSQLFVICW